MIAQPSESMAEAMKNIWEECFGDPRAVVDSFFESWFAPGNSLVWLEDGRPVSMLFMLPAELRSRGRDIPVKYIYAVSTLTAFRGRGISSALIERAASLGFPTLLRPASDGLWEFYRRLGYKPGFEVKTAEFTRGTLACAGASLEALTPREYKALRDERFASRDYVRWGEKAIGYFFETLSRSDGFALRAAADGKDFAVSGAVSADKITVAETTADGACIRAVAAALMGKYDKKACTFVLPADFETDGGELSEPLPFAAVRGADIENGYFNIAFE